MTRALLSVAIATAVACASATPPTPTTPEPSMTREAGLDVRASSDAERVRDLYLTTINGGYLDQLDALVDDDYLAASGERGRAAFRATIEGLRAGFPDIQFVVDDVIADGDRVVVRWRWTGTHRGAFRGIAPTGTAVHTSGIVIYQLRGGRIIRSWLETDRLGVLQQLGAVAAGKPAP